MFNRFFNVNCHFEICLIKNFILLKGSLSFTIGEHSESTEEGYEQTVVAQEILIHPKYYETEEYTGNYFIKIHIIIYDIILFLR